MSNPHGANNNSSNRNILIVIACILAALSIIAIVVLTFLVFNRSSNLTNPEPNDVPRDTVRDTITVVDTASVNVAPQVVETAPAEQQDEYGWSTGYYKGSMTKGGKNYALAFRIESLNGSSVKATYYNLAMNVTISCQGQMNYGDIELPIYSGGQYIGTFTLYGNPARQKEGVYNSSDGECLNLRVAKQ